MQIKIHTSAYIWAKQAKLDARFIRELFESFAPNRTTLLLPLSEVGKCLRIDLNDNVARVFIVQEHAPSVLDVPATN